MIVIGTLVFVALFSLIFGAGCAIAALHPRNRGRAFFSNTLFAATFLTVAFVCARAAEVRLGW